MPAAELCRVVAVGVVALGGAQPGSHPARQLAQTGDSLRVRLIEGLNEPGRLIWG